jgi:hypothetical protein
LADIGTGIVKHFGGLLYFWRLIAESPQSIEERGTGGVGLIIGFIQSVEFTLINLKTIFY